MSTRRLSIYPNSQNFDDNLFELQRNFTSLTKNLHELNNINQNLLTFNKNFAVFLQGLRLNSECFEFPEAPNADSYELARRPATPPPSPPVQQQISARDAAGKTHAMDMDDEPVSALSRPKSLLPADAGKQQQQQTKKRVVIKATGGGGRRKKPVFQTRRITDLLASRFQGHPHKETIERILKELHMNREGMYVHELLRDVGGGLSRNKCIDYLNALMQTEAVVRVNKKGHLFYLDPEKFP
ncbi:DASH complex subunit dam1 [Coemansia sp. RSA 1804]|nr:DASH complex subunit dam1 [Coemansia sp. RSA 1804]